MLKKALFVLMLAVQFFAASSQIQANDPMPECAPCPWAR
jgi:hypothetical protein